MTKIACVAVVKNEERHIAEWVAYQFVIGFDTVILLDNGSTDTTRAQAGALAKRYDLRIRDWAMETPDYQLRGYESVVREFGAQFDWMAFFDTDEFLVLEARTNLRACLEARDDAAAIAVSWALFGSSGHQQIPDGLVIETFRHRAQAGFGPNQHIKSIIRPRQMISCLNAHMFDVNGDYRDLAGRALTWQSDGVLAGAPDYAVGKLHHYFTRSAAHWREKMARGYHDTTRAHEMFHDYDRNEVFDESASHYAAEVISMINSSTTAGFSRRKMLLARIESLQAELSALDAQERVAEATESLETKSVASVTVQQPAERMSNLALHKPATQSSFSEWSFGSTPEDDAAGAVNGKIDGTRKFHTDFEQNPWWQVDLGGLNEISEVRIFNTSDHTAERFRNFTLAISADGERWVELARKQDGAVVGADGKPFIWQDDSGARGRIVRVTLLGNNFLHLDQVEVFGTPVLVTEAAATGFDEKAVADVEKPITDTALANDLIYDIGMSEGNDTAFYLAKGFRVVGVEADVQVYFSLCERFAESISKGTLTLYNMAAAERDGDIVEFFHHDLYQGLSGLSHGRAEFQEGNYSSYFVATVNWPALMKKHGVPHYLKIDIEGHEGPFLQSMAGAGALPEYISVECHSLSPVETLHALGYRNFKLIDQQPAGGFRLPAMQHEGRQIDWLEFNHASGPFGQDLPDGPWLDFEAFKQAYAAAQALHLPTWYDCHAWMPAGMANGG